MVRKTVYVGPASIGPEPTPAQYIEEQQIKNLFAECTRLLAKKASLTAQNSIAEFLLDFNKGEHVLLQPIGSLRKSALNKLSFLTSTMKIFYFEQEKMQRNGIDFIQILRLICSDFPREFVVDACRLLKEGKQLREKDKDKDRERQAEDAILSSSFNCKQFMLALAIRMLYDQLLAFVGAKSPLTLYMLFRLLRNIYSTGTPLMQKPPFDLLAEVLLDLSDVQVSQLTLVDQNSIQRVLGQRLIDTQILSRGMFKSQRLCKYLLARLHQVQNAHSKTNEVMKLLSEKSPPPVLSQTALSVQNKKKKAKK